MLETYYGKIVEKFKILIYNAYQKIISKIKRKSNSYKEINAEMLENTKMLILVDKVPTQIDRKQLEKIV